MGAQEGREGVEAEWERSDAFHEAWKLKARDMLARAEWRRRKLTKRVRACPACCLSKLGGTVVCFYGLWRCNQHYELVGRTH